jgi:hypothetical protein
MQPVLKRSAPFLFLLTFCFAGIGQDIRRSPSGTVYLLHEMKNGSTLDLPWQVLPFRRNYFGFSNGIFKDKNGFLWVGRPFGVQRFDGYEWHFFDVPFDDRSIKDFRAGKSQIELKNSAWRFTHFIRVEGFRCLDNGEVLLTSAGELFRFDSEQQVFQKVLSRAFLKEKNIAATDFFKIKPEGDSLLWFYGNTPGLFRYHFKSQQLDDFSKGKVKTVWDSVNHGTPDNVHDVNFDNESKLWTIGSEQASSGDFFQLCSLDPVTAEWTRYAFPGRYYERNRTDWYISRDIMMWDLCIDPSDSLVWVSCWEMGLCCFHKKTNKWEQFYLDLVPGEGAEKVRKGDDVEPYADSLILQATDDGFCVFNKKQHAFYHMDSIAGLPVNSPCRIFTSTFGDVFVSSQYGLFELENPKAEAKPLTVWFSKIRAGGTDRIGPVAQQVEPFSLFENERTLDIQFFGLPFRLPNLLEYRYKLHKNSQNWIETGQTHSLRLENLSGSYQLEVQARRPGGTWSPSSVAQFSVLVPFWKTGWFRVLAVLVLGGLLYAFFRFNIRRVRRESRFKQQLAEVEMAGLRAQMNPHFLFNCLASINHFLQQNQTEQASEYLTKFSRLVRQILDNSRTDKISLADEINALDLYLQLEGLRFGAKLRHSFTIDSEIDPEDVLIPPMILQPYIENAIWHGILPKTEGGEVQVIFSKKASGNLLVTIVDDGIGRDRSRHLKSRSALNQKSFGMKITEDRIAVINQLYKMQVSAKIQDLMDGESRPCGTLVVVEMQL